jgi:hypothetical protein
MRNRSLLSAMTVVGRLVFPITLCLSSCRTAPPPVEAKLSPEAESYKKTVEDRLGLLWYRLTEVHLNSLNLGTVQTTFEVPAAGGQARSVRVTSTTGNRIDGLIARRAIDQLRAPPIPAAILAQLPHDYLVFEEELSAPHSSPSHLDLARPFMCETTVL